MTPQPPHKPPHEPPRPAEHRPSSTSSPSSTPAHRPGSTPAHRPGATSSPPSSPIAHPATLTSSGGNPADSTDANQQTVIEIGVQLHAPELALLAAAVAGWGENHWNNQTCNPSNHCGVWQLSSALQAEHPYSDLAYWTRRAYQSGFWHYGGIIPMAIANPSLSPGDIANRCQGAYTDLAQGAAYYNQYISEARATVAKYAHITVAVALYVNPLKDAQVRAERIDMGVDYAGTGYVGALAAGVITESVADSPPPPLGWGGGYVEYRVTQPGPLEGDSFYAAEGLKPLLRVGDTVKAGDHIAQLVTPQPHGIEVGQAAGNGTGRTWAAVFGGGYTEGDLTRAGLAMSNLIAHLGGPPGLVEGRSPVGLWPRWAHDGQVPADITGAAVSSPSSPSSLTPSSSPAQNAAAYTWPIELLQAWQALDNRAHVGRERADAALAYASRYRYLTAASH